MRVTDKMPSVEQRGTITSHCLCQHHDLRLPSLHSCELHIHIIYEYPFLGHCILTAKTVTETDTSSGGRDMRTNTQRIKVAVTVQ